MAKKILLGLTLVLVIILAVAATRPDTFRVERATQIKAPPEKIFNLIDDFHQWGAWSPWERLDPEMKRFYSGAPRGKGAVYAWEGNSDVGRGRMEITDSDAPSHIVIALHFIEPFEAQNVTEFNLSPNGDSTDVRWSMRGRNPYIAKLMTMFVSMDSMVGKDFEAGLANMKAVAER
jgi:uncharacterized protein YndB with AHSA1/START domain